MFVLPRYLLCSLIALFSLATGCSGSKKIDLGGPCLLNSDCNSPLSCSFGKCHATCIETRDCPAGQSCLRTSAGSVCQLPAEADCRTAACDNGLVCATDYRCRVSCQTIGDCTAGQVCVTNVCADTTDLDVNGQLPQRNPAAIPDAGATDTALPDKPVTSSVDVAPEANAPPAGLTDAHETSTGKADGGPGVDAAGETGTDERAPDGGDTVPADGAADTATDDGASPVATGCSAPPVSTRYFCDDFESGLSKWLVATSGWNTVTASYQSPTHSVTDSPDGSYAKGAVLDITMTSSVDLQGAASPVLVFWHTLQLGATVCSSSNWATDHAYVNVSTDGGSTWTQLRDMTNCGGNNTTTWSFQQLSLSAYADKKIKLQFRLADNSDSSQADGWHLDDIEIREAN